MVVEMVFAGDGSLQSSDIYQATVRNWAKLAYNSAGRLAGGKRADAASNRRGQRSGREPPTPGPRGPEAAGRFGTSRARLIWKPSKRARSLTGDELTDLAVDKRNRAKDIIEDFMIAANGVAARFLASKKFPSLRRVVRVPKRWDRIVELAAERGSKLPTEPDAKALEQFLVSAKAADPLRFPDLSTSVVKLLGPGEYVVQLPGGSVTGHFGLAVKDYAHSTAPNRRFPDLITQRLLKAAMAGSALPYENDELANSRPALHRGGRRGEESGTASH